MSLNRVHIEDPLFKKALVFSGVGHGLLLAFLLLRAVFVPSEPIDLRNAIRVDVIGLPDKIIPPAAPTPAQTPPKVEIAKPAAEAPKLVEKSKPNTTDLQKKALDRLKALEAIDKLKQAQATPSAAPVPPQTFKGNTLNAGDSPRGLEKIQFDTYISQVRTRIHGNFHLPQWLAEADLHAQALAMIDENGYVIRREIVKSSGNDIFDNMVIEAIDKSSPFAAPPQALKSIMQFRGVIFRLPD